MRKSTIIWLCIGTLLVIAGALLFTLTLGANGWDFTKLSSVRYETNTYEIKDEFHNIRIDTDTSEVEFLKSEDGSCKVICRENTKARHRTAVMDDTLSVEIFDTRKWYDYIGIFDFGSGPKITVYLPESAYANLAIDLSTGITKLPDAFTFETINIKAGTGVVNCHSSASEQIKIKTSTGAIHMNALAAGELDLTVSTGNITLTSVTCEGDVKIRVSTGDARLTDVTCQNLLSEGDTGDMILKNVIAAEQFYLERDTGDIKFDRCDASELFIDTDTGDVNGSLLSEKVFIVRTDTGDVKVPSSINGGKCEIETDTGDVKIVIE